MPLEIGRAGVWPEGYYLSSGKHTVSESIFAGRGVIGGVTVQTDGTNDVTVTLYDDSVGAVGTILIDLLVPGADKVGGMVLGAIPIYAQVGCYLSISGTGGSCVVYYRT